MSNYSYIVVKPDGFKVIDKVLEEIEKRDFDNVNFFAITDFESIMKKLYYKHYQNGKKEFPENFEAYLYGIKSIYGNRGLVGLIQDDKTDYQTLANKVYDLKMDVRGKYANSNIAIATNMKEGRKNYIKVVSETGKEEKLRCLAGEGFHRLNDLNIIHSPDNDVRTTIQELKILEDSNIINMKNWISPKLMSEILKYKSGNVIDEFDKCNSLDCR